MRRLAVLKTWQLQQQGKFDDLKQSQGQLQQQYQAHQQRLALLEDLPAQYALASGHQTSAMMLKGIGRFRHQVDNLTRLQRQEMALTEVEMRSLNQRLVDQHRQVKMGETVVAKREAVMQQRRDKQEQKMLDELAMQRFVRGR
ncbi:flagellar FliJ family protein [Photobacterium aphoticum]|uniref:Flagellar FliJ protein n=1 Tax=Photobacterium aphoticum TaxID=754436 RepID=A0A090QZQ1_9GAMM|nr:flagellar FliJ family protein [Photobacterium aphoticum]KLV00632.1 hypothetical protein ABT58_11685 [Photobacterium aphoticum]PSU48789.1 hypothetical protein C9I90_22660 [Photobacterium aphoticum]GAL07334.1 hypothetical protein JCM19237_3273 [Photobacterium aphoticum]GHA58921.1 hypothetical protein GCM10007086_35930 [Photobacterium aphoticum]